MDRATLAALVCSLVVKLLNFNQPNPLPLTSMSECLRWLFKCHRNMKSPDPEPMFWFCLFWATEETSSHHDYLCAIRDGLWLKVYTAPIRHWWWIKTHTDTVTDKPQFIEKGEVYSLYIAYTKDVYSKPQTQNWDVSIRQIADTLSKRMHSYTWGTQLCDRKLLLTGHHDQQKE